MTTLVVSSYMPTRASGRAARTYGIVRALVADGPVDLLHTGFGAEAPDPAYEALEGLRLHPVGKLARAAARLAWARSRATGRRAGRARASRPSWAPPPAAWPGRPAAPA